MRTHLYRCIGYIVDRLTVNGNMLEYYIADAMRGIVSLNDGRIQIGACITDVFEMNILDSPAGTGIVFCIEYHTQVK